MHVELSPGTILSHFLGGGSPNHIAKVFLDRGLGLLSKTGPQR